MEAALLERQRVWRDRGAPGRKKVPFSIQGGSWAADYTGFYVPDWGLFLDAGLPSRVQPRAVIVTHTHTDHCGHLARICMGTQDDFNVFCHEQAVEPLQNMLEATTRLRACSMRVGWNSALFTGKIVSLAPADGEQPLCTVYERGQTPSRQADLAKRRKTFQPGGFHPNTPTACKNLFVRAVPLKHSIPTNGYIISEERKGLKPEYEGKTQEELDAMRKAGVDLNRTKLVPMLAFLCDCTSESAVEMIRLLRDAPPRVIMVECTYIDDADAEQAVSRKHVLWSCIRDATQELPNVVFLLIHFSQRYRDGTRLADWAKTLPSNVHAFL